MFDTRQQDLAINVLNTIEFENTEIPENDCRVGKEFSHPNTGVYAVEVEDMKGHRWILSPDDIEPEFMVENQPVDVLEVFQQTDGIMSYLVEFPEGSKFLVDRVNVRPIY
jgi:hypothetical protein